MEDLTKTQLILLALMVSFITSIATGIVTVTLLDQAPPGVTQTINRVVERTVERVVPGQAASVITKETTVVVKEEDLIIDAVDKNSKFIVRIGAINTDGSAGNILGLGVVVDLSGTVVTDSLNLGSANNFMIEMHNGATYPASVNNTDNSTGLSFLKPIKTTENSEETLPKFSVPGFGSASDIRLGQTVIAIGGLSDNTVVTGIVSKLNKEKTATSTDNAVGTEVLKSIVSNIPFSADYSGGPLLDVDGFMIGINLKRKGGDISVPVKTILDIISLKLENEEEVEA